MEEAEAAVGTRMVDTTMVVDTIKVFLILFAMKFIYIIVFQCREPPLEL